MQEVSWKAWRNELEYNTGHHCHCCTSNTHSQYCTINTGMNIRTLKKLFGSRANCNGMALKKALNERLNALSLAHNKAQQKNSSEKAVQAILLPSYIICCKHGEKFSLEQWLLTITGDARCRVDHNISQRTDVATKILDLHFEDK